MSSQAASALSPWVVFFWGALGGALPEFYYLFGKRRGKLPKFVKGVFYWAMFIGMSLLGGVAATLYSTTVPMNALIAVHLGLATPILLQLKSAESPLPAAEGEATGVQAH